MSESWLVMPRGVNVGAANRVPMAALRTALAEAGFSGVKTVGQSGNIVVAADGAGVADQVRAVIAGRFGVDAPCVARGAAQMAAVVAKNPLRAVADDPSRYLVLFFSVPPAPADVAAWAPPPPPEVALVDGEEAYVWHPDGLRAVRFQAPLPKGSPEAFATGRNWRTVAKLAALLGSA
ncbi:MAG: DUF1697 domain-containing protein [Propionibacteriaceae bacterium]|nr:DUF1697 domain-containing protein [Propionibacteriaceae bacterium]